MNKAEKCCKFSWGTSIVVLISLGFVCVFTYLSYIRFLDLSAPTFDLGVKIQSTATSLFHFPVDNANYAQTGIAFYDNFMAIHFSLLTFLMSLP
ncbi:MAG: hypothetical protein QXP36_13580, partial [Conexivisphaerales archaeon]